MRRNVQYFIKGLGKEFILDIEKNPNVMKWAIKLIKKHGHSIA